MTTPTRKPTATTGLYPVPQHSGNNEFLARCRAAFNAAIYAKTRDILNAEGEAAARAYLTTGVTRSLSF